MKILTAEEFAAAVMKNGTEVEFEEYKNLDCDEGEMIATIWAHIGYNLEILDGYLHSACSITADIRLTDEEAEALMNADPEIEKIEIAAIIEEIYPQYLEIAECFEE